MKLFFPPSFGSALTHFYASAVAIIYGMVLSVNYTSKPFYTPVAHVLFNLWMYFKVRSDLRKTHAFTQ